MRDILIRLDQRVDDGFKNIDKKLDNMERRADAHENRIRSLEDWRTEFKGGAKGLGFGWKALTAGVGLFGILFGMLASFGVKLMAVPDKPVTNGPQVVVTDK